MENTPKNKNVNAITIGFALILLVGAGTYLRSSFSNKPAQKKDTMANSAANVKIDAKLTAAADLSKKLNAKNSPLVLDIRPVADFAQEHIIDSLNLPSDSLESNLNSLDKNREIVIVDDTNTPESLNSLNNLFKNSDFNNFSFLDGGFSVWKGSGNPTIATGDINSITDRAKVTFIDSDSLKKKMETDKNLFIIDVRKGNEYTDGHIKNAVNIFLDDLEKKHKEIPLGKQIVVYDNDGQWAFQAATRLFDLGFFNTLSLSDGLNTWKQKNFEVVK